MLLCLALAGCGDLPRPFAGNPGANARRLSHPPPAKLVVPTPGQALLGGVEADRFAHAFADAMVAREIPAFTAQAQPGDWQAELSARLEGSAVIPRVALRDGDGKARGDVAGGPIPAQAWAAGDTVALRNAASELAPKFDDLLRAVEARVAQSDPNSLYNRPAQIYLAPVHGAPGDGNRSLFATMRQHLIDTGDQVVETAHEADFAVVGVVSFRHPDAATDQVEIHWHVTSNDGREAGDVAQGHDFPAGALSGYWGDVATAVAQEAAPGVHTIITNFSGRRLSRGDGVGGK